MPKHRHRSFAGILAALLALSLAAGALAAKTVPLPRPRPADAGNGSGTASGALRAVPGDVRPAPELSACARRLRNRALFTPLPAIEGPGECGATDVVRLAAVMMPDRRVVALDPPVTLRCGMAEAVSEFMRSNLAPTALALGAPLAAIATAASYDCRGRNRERDAKLSEHGRANALDISALKLADGRLVVLADPAVPQEARQSMRVAACRYFTTVLGPGADGFHTAHVHLDRIVRRGGLRLCQWDMRGPTLAAVPLPPPKPMASTGAVPKSSKRRSGARHK